MIYGARLHEPGNGIAVQPETYWFVSLDGEIWVGVTCDPLGSDEAEVRAMLTAYEARNNARKFQPMTIHRSFLAQRGAEFYRC